MKKKSKTSLLQCLKHAISLYNHALNEEQGGFILKEKGKDNYEFVPVKNQVSGTGRAVTLYVADETEFSDKVINRVLDDKWEIYASYHTHPNKMRAKPSLIDFSLLFTSFPINFIYSPDRELNRFDYDPEHLDYSCHTQYPAAKWVMTNILLLNGWVPPELNNSKQDNG